MQPIQNVLPPIVDEKTQVLVIGSMPGKQSLDKQQYYGNPRNHFWPIVGQLFETEIPKHYEDRIELLRSKGIGLWDSIESCERQGSLDATIKNEIPNDFEALFKHFPQIQLVLFNGGKSFDVFKKKVGLSLLEGRYFEKMPSTSPIPGKNIKSFDEKVEAWSILKNYLEK
ncbi:DNA-deoxyinosine glycosylase [Lysinibacillus sp. 2017]|uniref:DNA-deoxyinosine glycosylase n=1 Tax=unclassified Lysinibacillus TaxID=2636778 RepID=UPI000D526752|nr:MULTISPECIES: DNA-deoxyinosine glycosylase [unclassified Lysinibacillus]AWE08988.1 DNA-deoxyinosine glycosylase [Lysinibacillus sp. 2017]TGN35503.1 DNA-deoxyinosine glycosylase [Lysinibacillus sp. S2017]